MRRGALAAFAVAMACGPSERVVVVHPGLSDGASDVFDIAFTQQVTVPDNFVMRPDEFAAVTADPDRHAIYVGSREGTLLALDDRSGSLLWEVALGGAVSSRPTIVPATKDHRAMLLVGTDNGDLNAIDLESRETKWRYETAGKIRNRAITYEGVVYFVNSRDQIFALDLRSGEWRWQYEQELQTAFTVNGHAGLAFVPAAGSAGGEPGTIFTGFDNGKVVALGAGSGQALWLTSVAPPEGGDFVDCDSTPLIDEEEGQLIVAGQSTGIHGLSLDDGTQRWLFESEGVGGIARGLGHDVVATSSLEGVMALDETGQLLWRTQVDPGVLSEPVLVDGTVYTTHSERGLLAFAADAGTYLARIDPGSGMSSVPVYDRSTDQFYATTNRGVLVALRILRKVRSAPEPSGLP